jgi:general secretion pathway protein K
VLPSVLWITILTIAVAVNYASAVQLNTRAADNIKTSTLARYDAISGIYVAIERLLSNPSSGDSSLQLEINGNTVSVEISRESLKTSLNSASADELDIAFIEAGVDSTLARSLAARVVDWRDGNHSAQALGMEDADYIGNGKPYGAKDRPITDLVELLLMADIDPRLFRNLADYVTVYPTFVGNRFTLTARTRDVHGNQSFVTSAIVQLGNQRKKPYRIIKWQHHHG